MCFIFHCYVSAQINKLNRQSQIFKYSRKNRWRINFLLKAPDLQEFLEIYLALGVTMYGHIKYGSEGVNENIYNRTVRL
jgi:Uri superfamily endonuclease